MRLCVLMTLSHDPDADLASVLAHWSLKLDRRIADTHTSRVYLVRRESDSKAVLKILKPYGRDEALGFDLMQYYAGQGAAEVYARSGDALLMEWLEGETLGDLVRRREDDRATSILVRLVDQLHQPRGPGPNSLQTLETQFRPLLRGDFHFWPAKMRATGERCRQMAMKLLASSDCAVPLHGDFHHDNVVHSPRGWQVIDPKGLIGDPAYEFSNLFRNPVGADELVRNPARINRLAADISQHSGIPVQRLLGWAVSHAAISTFWHHSAGQDIEDDLTMLPLLLEACDRI